ncbi:MAG TPA: hypothetical protein VLX31_09315 [Streptosporangiaceae bacterium]|nr:hypothetical protein [Streptosporangiaceae bacterium]
MHGALLAAAIHPDNTPHGYNLTFAFPMLMFIIVAGALYLRFRGTHRVPGHVSLAASRWAGERPVTPRGATVAEAGGLVPAADEPAASIEQTGSAGLSADPDATVTADRPETESESTEDSE